MPRSFDAPRAARTAGAFLAGALAATALLLTVGGPPRASAHEMQGHGGPPGPAPGGEETFQSLMDAAMHRMDAGMTVAPTGDPDRDFAVMMIPHHQGAVDMALAELRFGADARLRRLAQGIIVEQRQEIDLMRQILATPRKASAER